MQFINRVLVLALSILRLRHEHGGVNARGVSVLVSVRMDGAIGMPVLVGVDVRVDVGMACSCSTTGSTCLFLLGAGEKSAAIAALEVISPPMGVEFYTRRPRAASQWAQYDNARIGKMASLRAKWRWWSSPNPIDAVCNAQPVAGRSFVQLGWTKWRSSPPGTSPRRRR